MKNCTKQSCYADAPKNIKLSTRELSSKGINNILTMNYQTVIQSQKSNQNLKRYLNVSKA